MALCSSQFRDFMADPAFLITAAGEDIHTYVEGANGWRGMGAADGRWQLGANTQLMTDFEYQHKVERSEAGYQLLGGTIVPAPVYPSVMLGFQSWSKPNTFDTLNAGARLERKLAANWNLRLGGSYSHSLIDDNVIWPYGPALDADGNSLCPDSPYYFFCPDGSYEIYDYRSPGELRIDAIGRSIGAGSLHHRQISHDVVGGGSIFHRTVDLSPTVVYAPLGVENVYQPNISYAPKIPTSRPAHPRSPTSITKSPASCRSAPISPATLCSRPAAASCGHAISTTPSSHAMAAAVWSDVLADPNLMLYGNYGALLSLGPQAPWWVDNANQFLSPFMTRQTEIGAKYEHAILLTAALFRMRQPFFYPKVIAGPDAFCPTRNPGGPMLRV